MWKRDDEKKEEEGEESVDTEPAGTEKREQAAGAGRPGGGQAVIGSSISIEGEVAGEQDLVIQGRVDGSVDLDQNTVTVGPDGDVTADITGRVITVEGHVKGDLTADEQIVLRSSARVEGDIRAPRVVLEDGARFRGGVQMGDAAERSGESGRSGSSTSKKSTVSAGKSSRSPAGSGGGQEKDEAGKDSGGSKESDGGD